MAKQPNFDAKEFCLNLLQSETDDEVINALKKYGYWKDRSAWKPYGIPVSGGGKPRSSRMILSAVEIV